MQFGWYDRATRRVRDLSSGDTRVYLEFEVRRLRCRACAKVTREHLDFLADSRWQELRVEGRHVGRGTDKPTRRGDGMRGLVPGHDDAVAEQSFP